MHSGLNLRSQNWPLAVVSAALGLGVVGALVTFANAADLAARGREHALLQSGVADRLEELARRPAGNAVWDDAVTHLDVAFDKGWAEANIGEFMAGIHDFELAAVLDRSDAPVYAMHDGAHADVGKLAEVYAAATPIIEQVRSAERERGPVRDVIAGLEGRPPESIHAWEVISIDKRLIALTATLVQPDFGTAFPRTDRSAIVLTGDVIDQAFISVLARRFLLEDARLGEPGAPGSERSATLSLKDASNREAAVIVWTPQRPGSEMLLLLMPLTVAALTSLALLASYFQKKGLRASERLVVSEARASHLAYHDVDTGLPNRLMLAQRLERASEHLRHEDRPFAVHCIDLNRFKEVNDGYGELAGQDLIREVAHQIAAACGPNDTLARLGIDEFAILQCNASRESAETLASQLITLLSEPLGIAAGRMVVGCSVGVTLVECPELDGSECLRQADLALNRAKARGHATYVVFEPDMDDTLRKRIELREELRTALIEGQLSVAYQPQVRQGGKMYGVEALVRWTHPERGEIAPSAFIPIAEDYGLIEALGMFVLRRAFEDSHQLGSLRVAVNLSAAQIRLRHFVRDLEALIEETGVDVGRIELEITEGLLLADDSSTDETLGQLRALGFRIALDDFGTGYSSLSYLQRYPIDKIKIDRSFIENLGADASADAVVNAIVRLARALHLDVIAEGVETELQRVRLAAAGCDDIQGYLFGRPMSLLAISGILGEATAHHALGEKKVRAAFAS